MLMTVVLEDRSMMSQVLIVVVLRSRPARAVPLGAAASSSSPLLLQTVRERRASDHQQQRIAEVGKLLHKPDDIDRTGRTVQRAQQIYVDKLATEGHEQAGERRNVDLVQQNGRQRFRSRLRGNLVRNKNLQPLRMYGLC